MFSFLACGNVMSDVVVQPNGETSAKNMGGPAFFALSGIKLWTDSCKLVSGLGADSIDTYGKWLDSNNSSNESVKILTEHTTCHKIMYSEIEAKEEWVSYYGNQNMGFMKTRPSDIDNAANKNVVGIYIAQGVDKVVWEKLLVVKNKYNFKIMWELEHFNANNDIERIKNAMQVADAWSLNNKEAAAIFKIDKDNDLEMIAELQKLPIETTFYRVGERGAYLVTKQEAYYCEAVNAGKYVDQTGCGNCSTGAAMYACFSGKGLKEALVIANVASGINALQYGTYPLLTKELRDNAHSLVEKYLEKVKRIF